jgi:hypothetical protein
VRPSEPGSSSHQSIENSTERVSINVVIDPDAVPVTKLNLDDALALLSMRRRRQWRFGHLPRRHRRPNLDRHKRRYTRTALFAKVFAPSE